MPSYQTSNRRSIASTLWIPFSWLVQALVFAIIASTVTAILGYQGSVEPHTALLTIALLPITGAIGAAIAATIVVRHYRGEDASSLGLFLRAFIWFFSFPARGWMIGFGWAVKFMLVHAVAVVIGFIGLLITWWAVSTMISMGANGWLIILVGIVLPFLTVGGAAWGNQYGSGTTGGMPIGCVLVVVLGIIGGFFWFCLLLVVLALFALPASIVLFSFHGGTFSSMEWEFYQWAIALGVFAVLVLPPFLVENSSKAARDEILDKLPFLTARRSRKRAAETRGAALLEQAEKHRRWKEGLQAEAEEARMRLERASSWISRTQEEDEHAADHMRQLRNPRPSQEQDED